MTNREIDTVVVKNLEELALAYNIRRQVFMVEGEEPEDEQFDGNDFCASHLLAYWKGQAVGTMRLRVVSGANGGTIMWERLSVLKDAREANPWIFRALMKSARRYSEMMGLKNVLGIVENPKLKKFWEIYGCRETGEEPLYFRGHAYTPMRLILDQNEDQELISLRDAVSAIPEMFVENRV